MSLLKSLLFWAALFLLFSPIQNCAQNSSLLEFPQINKINKPWTYWWWMGNAVDTENLGYNLEKFSKAGLGGVHIIPIYGVKGYEYKFIDYLSHDWMKMLAYTKGKSERLGMGVDMSLGTAWPMGGPWVSTKYASSQLNIMKFEISDNTEININLIEEAKKQFNYKSGEEKQVTILSVNAYSENEERIDITNHINSSRVLIWDVPNGKWEIIALVMEAPIQKVKRAAPGGQGNVVDPFSKDALNHYLTYFDKAFKNYKGKMVRAFYHDSYEYYNADWTKNFLSEFKSRRHYDLLDMLPSFLGEGDSKITARVKSDYRFTISELHTEFIKKVANWAHNKGALFRNQAHGSPTNLLDTYAAADIPECEVFGFPKTNIPELEIDTAFSRKENVDPVLLKFSSSAAHVSGKNLVSSETGTWLSEHFRVSLKQIKPEIDLLFTSGINHIFFHGIAYSPQNENWPGWLFYASTNYGPTNSIWHDLPSLTSYIARCQSVLQAGKPDNELLIYFPVWDIWNNSKGRLIDFQIHEPESWLYKISFYNLCKRLYSKGYCFDYISDDQISNSTITDGEILTHSNKYRAIVIPDCKFMPVKTLQSLSKFAKKGVKIIFAGQLPQCAPGFFQYKKRTDELKFVEDSLVSLSKLENVKILFGNNIFSTLSKLNIPREKIADYGINFIRRKINGGRYYFITNQTSKPFNKWVDLAYPAKSVVIFDPLTGKKGLAKIKYNINGSTSVFLQLEAGASLILKTIKDTIIKENLNSWKYLQAREPGFNITGEWSVQFIEGGPVIPCSYTIHGLKSWTTFDDSNARRFAGTARYKIKFNNPDKNVHDWILDLGKVCESARIKINGQNIGTLWSIPFRISIGNILKKGENEIIIDVTNLAANRIRDLDTRGVNWQKFYDINFVNINYKKFNASKWNLVDSGLLGPVKLYPSEKLKF